MRDELSASRIAQALEGSSFECDIDFVDVITSVECAMRSIGVPFITLGVPLHAIPNDRTSRRARFLIKEGFVLISASENSAMWVRSAGSQTSLHYSTHFCTADATAFRDAANSHEVPLQHRCPTSDPTHLGGGIF